MKITLIVEELLKDIREKSSLDTEGMEPEVKYRVEAGSEKNDQLKREIITVSSVLTRTLSRYLADDDRAEADNMLGLSAELTWKLNLSERRTVGKAQPLTDACHDYMVHYVLARYYKSVNAGELSNKHSLLTADAAKEIEQLLYTKTPPRYE